MQSEISQSGSASGLSLRLSVVLITALFALPSQTAQADESGVSFWVPGQFGSLAAVPQTPGWSLGAVYYHTTVSAGGNVAAAREIQIGRFPPTVNVSLNANLNAQADLLFLAPTYTFATPVLGGQFAVGITGLFGRTATSIDGTLTAAVGPVVATRMGSISDALTSVGDLYPMATLKWNAGVHNWMTYATGDIPVGAYDPNRLSNLGIGHGAIDGGGGYTYFNPTTGHDARRWPADRLPLSDWKHAGISKPERLWRVRCGKQAIGLEYLADLLDFTGGPRQHRNPNQAFGDEVRQSDHVNPKGWLPVLAPNGHADPIERCPLLGPKQKTSARSEHFAF
jgi:hypothetical protein